MFTDTEKEWLLVRLKRTVQEYDARKQMVQECPHLMESLAQKRDTCLSIIKKVQVNDTETTD